MFLDFNIEFPGGDYDSYDSYRCDLKNTDSCEERFMNRKGHIGTALMPFSIFGFDCQCFDSDVWF